MVAIPVELAAARALRTQALLGPEWLTAVRHTPPGVKTLMLIGHNPGIAELALSLAGYGDRYALARMMQKFPTCALAVLDFDMETWKEAAIRTGRLDRFVTPADFGGEDGD